MTLNIAVRAPSGVYAGGVVVADRTGLFADLEPAEARRAARELIEAANELEHLRTASAEAGE